MKPPKARGPIYIWTFSRPKNPEKTVGKIAYTERILYIAPEREKAAEAELNFELFTRVVYLGEYPKIIYNVPSEFNILPYRKIESL